MFYRGYITSEQNRTTTRRVVLFVLLVPPKIPARSGKEFPFLGGKKIGMEGSEGLGKRTKKQRTKAPSTRFKMAGLFYRYGFGKADRWGYRSAYGVSLG